MAEIEGRALSGGGGGGWCNDGGEKQFLSLSRSVFVAVWLSSFFGLIFFNTYWYIILFARGMAFFFLFLCSKRYI